MAAIPLLSLRDPPAAFLSALSDTGFLHLSLLEDKGNPLSPAAVKHAFALSSVLYDEVSLAERCEFTRDESANGHTATGSTYLNREGGQEKPDWKEGFGYGRFEPGQTWDQKLPAKLEERRDELEQFWEGCTELMMMVLDKLSLAFDVSVFTETTTQLMTDTLFSCPKTTSGELTKAKAVAVSRC